MMSPFAPAGHSCHAQAHSGTQAIVTVGLGDFAENLDITFTSFSQNSSFQLHVFVIGEALPVRRVEGVTYHLRAPDPAFFDPMRDLYHRRFKFIEEVGAEYVLLVDISDVLCVQQLPSIPNLLRGAAFGGCVEHAGSRYLANDQYTSAYINAGVTFWNVPASARMRGEIVERGLSRFRSIGDQVTLNEVIHLRYFDRIVLLPSQYNYRACLSPVRLRGWPTVSSLDGVIIYHNKHCINLAKQLLPVRPKADLPLLERDKRPLGALGKLWRRLRHRLDPHWVR